MSFTPPVFNVSADFWTPPNDPATGGPDASGNAQLYINSRGLLDLYPGDPDSWIPPIWLRRSFTDQDSVYALGVGYIIEIPGLTTQALYYKVRWWDFVHLGFPNAYAVFLCEQCMDDGTTPDGNR